MIACHPIVLASCTVSPIASTEGGAVRVVNEYPVVSRGEDQQLEAAVTALLALLR
jgi:hypothetical protein